MRNRNQTIKARYLRKIMTEQEKILWQHLRDEGMGFKFRRQHPIDKFVIDFYCTKLKLAIELDGSPHTNEEGKEYDVLRTKFLEHEDIKILRFWNSEVENNISKVLEKIRKTISNIVV